MTNNVIEKFVEEKSRKDTLVNIHFTKRNTISGLSIRSRDYAEFKSKNFWRIVPESRLQAWEETKDENLARIFNGAEFTRLTSK